MTKISVIIGEGASESNFFPSLIRNKFGFTAESDKHTFIYRKGEELFWFFLFPPHGPKKPRTGKSRFLDKKTYYIADTVVSNNLHLFAPMPEVHYRIFHDGDGLQIQSLKELEKKLAQVFQASGVSATSFTPHFVHKMIESWYIAGLPADFPYFENPKSKAVADLMRCDPDSLHDPKGDLDAVLQPELRISVIKKGEVFGELFDLEAAKRRSKSFREFMEIMEAGVHI